MSKDSGDTSTSPTLNGQLLIAMPSMTDQRFARSVVYICAHSDDGAMGLIINQPAEHITFPELLEQLELVPEGKGIHLSEQARQLNVNSGGPVDTGRGFVLHSSDYHSEDSTLEIDDSISLTATIDILKAIAEGRGPKRAILALGYAGWAPGQLEMEIRANGWLNCPASTSLVFDCEAGDKYRCAFEVLGVDLSHLVSESGRA